MAKYLVDSTDIEIEEVSGTENLKFNLASGNSVKQMIGDLSNLNTTSKSNIVNAINEVNQNQINSNTYSTTETVIGKWINNKPIYRKAITGTTVNTGNDTNVTTISNMDILLNIYGGIIANNYFNPIGLYTSPTNYVSGYAYQNGSVSLRHTDNYQSSDYYCVIEYTKTTD